MTELSDYRRIVSDPQIKRLEETVRRLSAENAELKAQVERLRVRRPRTLLDSACGDSIGRETDHPGWQDTPGETKERGS